MLSRGLSLLSGKYKLGILYNKVVSRMSSQIKVKVKQGTIVGGEAKLPNGSLYHYFKGVPYAAKPVGELRFQNPVPLKSFESPEIKCTKEGDVCFQKDPLFGEVMGSEDCLYLNVYTPRLQEKDEKKTLPVMVFIHGGAYIFGSSNSNLYNPLYLMQEDVVVVTLNYRLGVLGFLYLPEANIPGNAGLKDQRLALQWINKNISQFGGDPNNVTIFGESAGGSSAHLHFLSKDSGKLFHKAICQSGTANMPWAMKQHLDEKSIQMAMALGCPTNNQIECAKILKNHTKLSDFQDNLLSVLTSEERRRGLPLAFGPVVEENSPTAIVTTDPIDSMNKLTSIDIPLMIGYNSSEGLVMLKNVIKKLNSFDKDLTKLLPRTVNLKPEDPENKKVAQKMRDFYFGGAKLSNDNLDNLQELLTDFNFTIDAYVAAEIHSRKLHNSPLYFYRFDYEGELNFYKRFIGFEKLKGVCHGDELFYLFQSRFANEPWAEKDKKMVKKMCKLWANFARNGNPTPEKAGVGSDLIDCIWNPVKKIRDDEKFVLDALSIDDKSKMIRDPNIERIEFWRQIHKEYNNKPIVSKL